jgi:hypothetical protein
MEEMVPPPKVEIMIDPKEPIVVNGKDEGVAFRLAYFPVREPDDYLAKEPVAFSLEFTSPERCAEFFKLMARALNCNDPAETPDWALGLMDYVTGTPTQPSPKKRRSSPPDDPSGPVAPGAADPAEVSTGFCQIDETKKVA